MGSGRGMRKHPVRRALLVLLMLGVLTLLFLIGKALLWGRWATDGRVSGQTPRVELDWEAAIADGELSPLELATHYAPEIHAAVNVILSDGGRGDFLAAANYDGDWAANNNWEHLSQAPLNAVVYYSVQETETHYFLGYYFYHPRDDAEIWLDCHENDFEGIMLAARKSAEGFLPPELMYTQGHGGVPFFFDEGTLHIAEGSRRDGSLALDGDRPVVYIAPNGTLDYAGHSVESAANHSTYWAVGNSGVRYYHGGVAEEPATWKGAYEKNPCSYELRSLDELWERRDGPYGEGNLFGSYGAFCGDNFEKDAANPAWGWRNKTQFGYGGSFLSDPAWTIAHAVNGLTDFSCRYVRNPYADWRLTISSAQGIAEGATLELLWNDWVISTPAWWRVEDGRVWIGDEGRDTLWIAAPADTVWTLRAVREDGSPTDAELVWEAAYLGQ